MEERLLLGISSCLLGNQVRYDGQHKYDNWLVETLGRFVDYKPVCPEVECGLPVPREAMRLVGTPEDYSLLTAKTGVDITPQMLAWTEKKIPELKKLPLCGFVFKSKSPSSGMERVKLYPPKGGAASKKGVGIFARAFMEAYPDLPVEEEGRLHDPVLRENFIERIFVVWRWHELLNNKPTAGAIVDFHSRHKLLIMAHSPAHYRALGKMVAAVRDYPPEEFQAEYFRQLMEALRMSATRKKQTNVLQHILGYFKNDLTADEKAEILEIFAAYRDSHYPLIVPITLLNHYVRKYGKDYLATQYYLHPHPMELNLRNHV